MEITRIELKNFRNYNHQIVNFETGLNILQGQNAQGKTNLLEAIFLCAIGKSPRTNKEKDLIKWEEKLAKVTVEFKKICGKQKIEIYLFSNQNKAIKLNGMPIKKIGELMGELNAIYFSPDELKLIKESPEERRRFMDIDLSQFSKNYFYALSKYNKILTQRNKLLKSGHLQSINSTISIWNEQLSEQAVKIIMARLKFIEDLSPIVKKCHYYLTDNKEEMKIAYVGQTTSNADELKQNLLNSYNASLQKDIKLGYTTVGPHRDDISIKINDIDVRNFGSQGQQRSCALSLKLAELEVFSLTQKEKPILLLDDVLSELDINRKNKLLKFISTFQTILTCTEFDSDYANNILNVFNGVVK